MDSDYGMRLLDLARIWDYAAEAADSDTVLEQSARAGMAAVFRTCAIQLRGWVAEATADDADGDPSDLAMAWVLMSAAHMANEPSPLAVALRCCAEQLAETAEWAR